MKDPLDLNKMIVCFWWKWNAHEILYVTWHTSERFIFNMLSTAVHCLLCILCAQQHTTLWTLTYANCAAGTFVSVNARIFCCYCDSIQIRCNGKNFFTQETDELGVCNLLFFREFIATKLQQVEVLGLSGQEGLHICCWTAVQLWEWLSHRGWWEPSNMR